MSWEALYELSLTAHGRQSLIDGESELRKEFVSLLVRIDLLSTTDRVDAGQLLKRLRTLRNVCCGSDSMVKEVVESGVVSQLFKICRYLALNYISEDRVHSNKNTETQNEMFVNQQPQTADQHIANETTSSESSMVFSAFLPSEDDKYHFLESFSLSSRQSIILVICQLLSNISASSDDGSEDILKYTDSDGGNLRDALAASVAYKNRKAVAAVWSTIYNTIVVKNQDIGPENAYSSSARWHKRINKISSWRGFICQAMLSVSVDNSVSQKSIHVEGSASLDDTSNSDDDPVLEWVQLFLDQICAQNVLSLIFNTMNSTSEAELLLPVVEQVIYF